MQVTSTLDTLTKDEWHESIALWLRDCGIKKNYSTGCGIKKKHVIPWDTRDKFIPLRPYFLVVDLPYSCTCLLLPWSVYSAMFFTTERSCSRLNSTMQMGDSSCCSSSCCHVLSQVLSWLSFLSVPERVCLAGNRQLARSFPALKKNCSAILETHAELTAGQNGKRRKWWRMKQKRNTRRKEKRKDKRKDRMWRRAQNVENNRGQKKGELIKQAINMIAHTCLSVTANCHEIGTSIL